MQAGPVLILCLFTFSAVQGQSPQKQSAGTAQGSLQVTATVEPSVWLVMEPDGKQKTVIANAPDAPEAFFHAPSQNNQSLKKQKTSAARPSVVMPSAQGQGKQNEAAVEFSLPTQAKQFDVKLESMVMNVSDGGKTGHQLVAVTTVVPR
jgi:hypothetical protein